MKTTNDNFIPGLKLNRNFYFEVIKPLMDKHFPNIKYAAGLIANGSDVLGYDDPTSTDHNWGPRMRMVFFDNDYHQHKAAIDEMFRHNLPATYEGFPTNFVSNEGYLKSTMEEKKRGPINHLIRFYGLEHFFEYFIGTNPKKKLAVEDWLVIPQQALLEVTSGEVYHDEIGLDKYRKKFAYYPKEVWVYMLYIQWNRLANLLGFPSRAGMTGDDFGSRLIVMQVINEVVKLLFLMEQKYMPYAKWRGRAFSELQSGPQFIDMLTQLMSCPDWQKRQKLINQIHLKLAEMQNDLKLTKNIPPKTKSFHNRAFEVADIKPYSDELYNSIETKKIKNLSYHLGAIDQFIDHVKINHMDYVYNEFKDIIS